MMLSDRGSIVQSKGLNTCKGRGRQNQERLPATGGKVTEPK
jgi:hypothetical protein